MNKIEKYISLYKEALTFIEEQEFDKALPFLNERDEIEKSYRLEDLVSDLDSIGYKVADIDKLRKQLLDKKKQFEDDGEEFTEATIGTILLWSFSKFYEEHMDTPYAKEHKARMVK